MNSLKFTPEASGVLPTAFEDCIVRPLRRQSDCLFSEVIKSMSKPLRTPKLWQKALAMYVLALAVGLYCNSVMFTHIDSLSTAYAFYLKAGLVGIVDVSIFWLVTWKLFGPSPELRVYCFWATGVLMVVCLIHAGAVFKLEASKGENLAKINAVADAQARIAAATTSAAIEASGKQAQEMNARGQRLTARRTIEAGKGVAADASSKAQENLNTTAEKAKSETFLPQSYLDGAMYWALMAIAGIALMWAFKIWGDTGLDIDGDGVANEMFAYKTDRELERIKREREAEKPRTGFAPPGETKPATASKSESLRDWITNRYASRPKP